MDEESHSCPYCSSRDGDDHNYYVTLKIPGFPLMHEADPYCWCEPEVAYDCDGEEYYIHQRPN